MQSSQTQDPPSLILLEHLYFWWIFLIGPIQNHSHPFGATVFPCHHDLGRIRQGRIISQFFFNGLRRKIIAIVWKDVFSTSNL